MFTHDYDKKRLLRLVGLYWWWKSLDTKGLYNHIKIQLKSLKFLSLCKTLVTGLIYRPMSPPCLKLPVSPLCQEGHAKSVCKQFEYFPAFLAEPGVLSDCAGEGEHFCSSVGSRVLHCFYLNLILILNR